MINVCNENNSTFSHAISLLQHRNILFTFSISDSTTNRNVFLKGTSSNNK